MLSDFGTPNYEEISMYSNVSAFQDYTSDMMGALNNPWVPKGRKTTTPSWTKVALLVYLSPHGTPVEG